jgi:predicted RND superfamily exporter protein
MEKMYKYPWLIVLVILVITVFFGLQLPHIKLDNNNFRFISGKDEARKTMADIDETFGSSLFILVGFRRSYGTVFDPAFLDRIREYVDRIEAIDIIDPVSSIVNADYITGDGESITVEKLLPDDFSGRPEEISLLKDRLLSWDMYKRSLISDDFSSTQILVPMTVSSEDVGKPDVVKSFTQVRDIAKEMFDGMAEVYVTGIPVISATISEAVNSDLRLLVPLVTLVVLLVLFFSFRRLSGVVLPLLTVLIAVIWSMGAMPLFDIKLSVISTVLPVILVAVGSAYGIHVLTHYLEDSEGRQLSREEHRELVLALVRRIAKPVFLAALTTFVGFLSFCFTTVLPIREFGFFSSFGVLSSFIVALTLIPALLLLRGPSKSLAKTAKKNEENSGGAIPRFFTAIAMRRGAVLFVAAAAVLVSVYGASRIIIDNVFVEYFKNDTDISRSDSFIREYFGGSKVISVMAQAESSEILLSPESLSAMDRLETFLETRVPEAGKAMGFTGLVKRINQVVNVDESPEGFKAAAQQPAGDGDEEPSFGFGDEEPTFGFGNEEPAFGFGESSPDSAAAGLFEPAPEPPAERAGNRTYTMEEITALLDRASHSGASRGLDAPELVWELKRLTNYNGASYYEIPVDPAKYGKRTKEELAGLVSDYLFLLSGNIGSYANDPLEPTAIKTTVQLRTLGEADTGRALGEIRRFISANFPPEIKVTIGGSAMVESSLNRQVVSSQLISVIISLCLVFLIVAVSNRSFAAGLIGIAPLTISILINFAVMGFLGIKLNIGTSMIASLAVGIGIDYTIHYMEAYKREFKHFKNSSGGGSFNTREFLSATFAISGKAIIINAVSVGAGFAVLLFSRFNMMGDLGLLITLTMGTSALVSLTVIPALLLAFKPAFVTK